MSKEMADEDFDEQLRQEELEKARAEGDYGTYTDADGTVFEWDAQKKAYFPKIDEDFIAKYQMNYGQPLDQGTTEVKAAVDTKQEEEKRKAYEQSCRDYYNYYYANQTSESNGERKEGGDNSGKGDNQAYSFEDYMNYCNYFYGTNSGEGHENKGEGGKEEKKEEVKHKTETEKPISGEKKKEKVDAGWFDHNSEKSTHIYISGLPLDITDDEYRELMNKYGLIMYDPFTRKPKLKLYKDENGQPKGDGLCCFIKQESVDLALNLLDGSEVRGHKVSVERAQFQMKGEYNPSKKRKKLSNKDKRKIKEKQQKLFDWRPEKEEGRQKCEKTVILKNMFDPKEFEENPMEINDLRVDVRAEAAKFGEVKKVTVYDRHPDGVISVKYKEAEEADLCISNLNGRWFAKRRIIAQSWDGKTKYEVQETKEEREERLSKWEKFLESSGTGSATSSAESSTAPAASTESAGAASTPTVVTPVSAEPPPETTAPPPVPPDNSSIPSVTLSDSGSADTSKTDQQQA